MKLFKHSIVFTLLIFLFGHAKAQIDVLEPLYLNSLAASFTDKEFRHNGDNLFWSKCLGRQSILTNSALSTEIKSLLNKPDKKKEFYQRINYYLSSQLSYYYDILRVSKTVADKKKGLDKDGYEDYIGADRITLSVLGSTGNHEFYKYIQQQGLHAALAQLCVPVGGDGKPANIPENAPKDSTDKRIFQFVEHVPEYPGGETELLKFLSRNIIYPKMERDNDIQGRVMLRFVICTDGRVSNVEVTRSVSPGIDAEACRVVKMLPSFNPGTQQGKPVLVYYSLPLVFKLQ